MLHPCMETKAAIAYKKHRALPKQHKQLDLEGKVLIKNLAPTCAHVIRHSVANENDNLWAPLMTPYPLFNSDFSLGT